MGQKYPNKTFLVPNLSNFVSLQNFVISLIRMCWFQIWQYCFQIPVQKYPNQAFLVPNLGTFVLPWHFANRQIWGWWFQIYDNSFIKILAQKCPNKAFLIPNLGIFCFFTKFCNCTNLEVLISNMTIVL